MFTLAENGYQDTKIAQPTNKHTCSYLNAKVFITTSQLWKHVTAWFPPHPANTGQKYQAGLGFLICFANSTQACCRHAGILLTSWLKLAHVCVSVNRRYGIYNISDFLINNTRAATWLTIRLHSSTPPHLHTAELPGWLLRRLSLAPPWSPAFCAPSHKLTAVRVCWFTASQFTRSGVSRFFSLLSARLVKVLQLSQLILTTSRKLSRFTMSAVSRRSSMGVSDAGRWLKCIKCLWGSLADSRAMSCPPGLFWSEEHPPNKIPNWMNDLLCWLNLRQRLFKCKK